MVYRRSTILVSSRCRTRNNRVDVLESPHARLPVIYAGDSRVWRHGLLRHVDISAGETCETEGTDSVV
jgi:mannose-6-phosphate isomerase class I